MRRGGPAARAESARGLLAARTDSEEEEQLAAAFAASLRIQDDQPLTPSAPSAEPADEDWVLVQSPRGQDSVIAVGGEGDVLGANLARAALAGDFARRKLASELQRVPRTPAPKGGWRNTRYVVCRSPLSTETGVGVGTWGEFRRYTELPNGRLHPDAVFHGFATQAEAERYWQHACPGLPLRTLPPWPLP